MAENNRVAQEVSGNFQLTCSTPCGPSFFFLESSYDYSTWFFLFKQDSTFIFFIGFLEQIQEF